jgi:hypothetical protein
MSQPATYRAQSPDVSSPPPQQQPWRKEESAIIQLDRQQLSHIPFGIIHLNSAWQIVEYQRRTKQDLRRELAPAGGLESLAAWMMHPAFVAILDSALHSSSASAHFDFNILAVGFEGNVHINILAFGDSTAWLFISDRPLDPF